MHYLNSCLTLRNFLMEVTPCEHHKKAEFCYTRPPYRQGKEFKAVKVYTINDESQHLLIQNVPSIGLLEEIKRLTNKFGETDMVELVEDYPVEEAFTNVFHVKYKSFSDARQAKKRLDNRSFYGNILHVCYAPELETIDECRRKLTSRKRIMPGHFKSKRKSIETPEHVDVGGSKSAISSQPESGVWSHLLPSTSTKVVSNFK